MEIKDLAGLSKPITRLIEVISEGVGAVTHPYLIRKTAEAKAYEAKVISEALSDIAKKHQLPVKYQDGELDIWQKQGDRTLRLEAAEVDDRIPMRLDYEERKRQDNLERITSVAAEDLANEKEVPEERPDEDWVSRFFGAAKDVSSEQMQTLWGRILSGEIRRPGSFSLRTIEFVRNISKAEAELIEKIGGFATFWENNAFVAIHDKEWLREQRKIYPGHHFSASEVGAMYPTDLVIRCFMDDQKQQEALVTGSLILIVDRNEINGEVKVPIWKFTETGRELLKLIPSIEDEKYLESIGQYFLKKKGKAFLARVIEKYPDGRIQYNKIRDIVENVSAEKPEVDT